MIQCDLCEEKATVFLTQIIDGQMQKVNLCESCSKEKGVTDPTGFALADLLVGVGSEQQVGSRTGDSVCSSCGFTAADFKRVGRLGCPECYATFADDLEGIIKAMHKGTRHVGKAPARLGQLRAVRARLDELRGSLDGAVAAEDYEEAARLRDEILRVEEELKSAREQSSDAGAPAAADPAPSPEP